MEHLKGISAFSSRPDQTKYRRRPGNEQNQQAVEELLLDRR
jgi:hypothetical protein